MRAITRILTAIVPVVALGGAAMAQLQPGGSAGINQPAPSSPTAPSAGAPTSGSQPGASPVAGTPAPEAVSGRVTPGARGAARRRENPVISIQEMVRLDTQAASQLRGVGIVTGLKGTGDSGSELVLARPLAQIYANNGNPIGDIRDLAKGKSAAIVSLWVEVPESGGVKGDRFDLYVSVMHSASSLKGGKLEISPLLGPLPGQGVFAFGAGLMTIEDTETPTVGVIRGGAQLIRDIRMPAVRDAFTLVVRPEFRSYATTRMLASEINGLTADLEDTDRAEDLIARAIDDMTIRVTIPERERANASAFVASILTKRFSPSLLDLPAQVIVNARTGTILVTGDVEISAATVGNDKIVVTTVTGARGEQVTEPTATQGNWTDFSTASTNSDRARIEDLLQAFTRLAIPVRDQIGILAQLHQSGRLHARLIYQ